MTLTLLVMIVGATMGCTVLLTLLVTRWWDYRQLAQHHTQQAHATLEGVIERLALVERQLSTIGQAVMPITSAFQMLLIRELTHFHEPETDVLLEKLGPPMTLTEAEEERLLALMEQRERDMGHLITPSERDAAHILPLIMKRVRAEAQAIATLPTTLRLVTIASHHEASSSPRESVTENPC